MTRLSSHFRATNETHLTKAELRNSTFKPLNFQPFFFVIFCSDYVFIFSQGFLQTMMIVGNPPPPKKKKQKQKQNKNKTKTKQKNKQKKTKKQNKSVNTKIKTTNAPLHNGLT